jgi:hypothetical protein
LTATQLVTTSATTRNRTARISATTGGTVLTATLSITP